MAKEWIRKAADEHAKGALHRMLGISENENIPITALKRIMEVPNGHEFSVGDKIVKVTPLLKKRANFALNIHNINIGAAQANT